MAEATEVENEAKSFKQREADRMARMTKALTRLDDIAERVGLKTSQRDLISSAALAIETLQKKLIDTLPEDFRPPGASAQVKFTVGDEVSPKGEAAVLYTKADAGAVVKEVIHHGGNEEGKGAKIFLKVKRTDGTVVTVPASHFE